MTFPWSGLRVHPRDTVKASTMDLEVLISSDPHADQQVDCCTKRPSDLSVSSADGLDVANGMCLSDSLELEYCMR